MKYGVNTMVWTTRVDDRLAPLFAKIKRWGFGGVEVFLSPDEPANVALVRKMLDATDLQRTTCRILPRQANLVSSDAAVRARGLGFLKKCLDRALPARQCTGKGRREFWAFGNQMKFLRSTGEDHEESSKAIRGFVPLASSLCPAVPSVSWRDQLSGNDCFLLGVHGEPCMNISGQDRDPMMAGNNLLWHRLARISSNTKTKAFTKMMTAVTRGTRAERRDASPNGTKPPMPSL